VPAGGLAAAPIALGAAHQEVVSRNCHCSDHAAAGTACFGVVVEPAHNPAVAAVQQSSCSDNGHRSCCVETGAALGYKKLEGRQYVQDFVRMRAGGDLVAAAVLVGGIELRSGANQLQMSVMASNNVEGANSIHAQQLVLAREVTRLADVPLAAL
jgi:hypothetical protein